MHLKCSCDALLICSTYYIIGRYAKKILISLDTTSQCLENDPAPPVRKCAMHLLEVLRLRVARDVPRRAGVPGVIVPGAERLMDFQTLQAE